MNWEKVLKQPELQQPPMEQPPMEEPMVDPTTGLPLDPMAQQAGMAVPPQTPTNPNPTGEEEFPVDPEVEDDAKLNKWFSTIVKQTRQTTLSEFQPPQPDPNKKKEQDRLLAQRNAQMQQALGQASANRGQQAQRAVGASLPQGRMGQAIQLASGAKAAVADTATGRELVQGAKNIKQGLKEEKDTLMEAGKNVLDAGKKVFQTGQQAIANPKGAVREAKKNLRAMGDETKESWKDAVKRRNERVYGGYENPQQQKEAEEKERIAERQKKIAERVKFRQEQQAIGANKPRQYTDPETGEVKDMERGYADTAIEESDVSDEDEIKFQTFKDAFMRENVNPTQYRTQQGYRTKINNILRDRYKLGVPDNLPKEMIAELLDALEQPTATGEKVEPRLLTEKERVEAFKRQKEGRGLTSAYLAGREDEVEDKDEEKKMDLQKQDRRDDPALWESWDGGLGDY